ncbi:MAG: NHLP bacteriocin system secretion protein [Bacillota bacterium]
MIPKLFRDVSLERLSSPEQLDSFTTFVSPRGWIAMLGLGFFIATALFWGIFGSIPIKVQGQGIMISQGGVAGIAFGVEGQVTDIKVSAGEMVGKGEVVARIFNPEWMKNADPAMPEEIANHSRVVSPYSGRVLEVIAQKGEWVKPGAPLMSVEIKGQDVKELEAVLYIPLEEGKRILPGMDVQISPSVVKREEFGYMLGRVTSVSEFPVAAEGMIKLLGSRELAEKFSGRGTPVEVHVDLTPDAGTISGYKWSSRGGPPVKIDGGTLCQGEIILKKVRPIELAIPIGAAN